MRSWDVPVPTSLSSTGYVRATGVGPPSLPSSLPSSSPPVLLLHGFDSSCLEYRRLHPLLSPHLDTFALDIMGWGFSQLRGINEFSAEAKREYLFGFWKNVLKGKKMVLVGASLGGAAAVDFAHSYPEAVEKLVLIDAQVLYGFVRAFLPPPLPLHSLFPLLPSLPPSLPSFLPTPAPCPITTHLTLSPSLPPSFPPLGVHRWRRPHALLPSPPRRPRDQAPPKQAPPFLRWYSVLSQPHPSLPPSLLPFLP